MNLVDVGRAEAKFASARPDLDAGGAVGLLGLLGDFFRAGGGPSSMMVSFHSRLLVWSLVVLLVLLGAVELLFGEGLVKEMLLLGGCAARCTLEGGRSICSLFL